MNTKLTITALLLLVTCGTSIPMDKKGQGILGMYDQKRAKKLAKLNNYDQMLDTLLTNASHMKSEIDVLEVKPNTEKEVKTKKAQLFKLYDRINILLDERNELQEELGIQDRT